MSETPIGDAVAAELAAESTPVDNPVDHVAILDGEQDPGQYEPEGEEDPPAGVTMNPDAGDDLADVPEGEDSTDDLDGDDDATE